MASIEEKVEDWVKEALKSHNVPIFAKTEAINQEINNALKTAPSKQGGTGRNMPDVQCMVQLPNGKHLPVMIEVKGLKGKLEKLNKQGKPENTSTSIKNAGAPLYKNINDYAANGAVHYAHAILENTSTYSHVIAVGVNDDGQNFQASPSWQRPDISAWYVSSDNLQEPLRIEDFDFSQLASRYAHKLEEKLKNLSLNDADRVAITKQREATIENSLTALNEAMHKKSTSAESRLILSCGLIIAGLSITHIDAHGKLQVKKPSLEISDLKGRDPSSRDSDAEIILRSVEDYLNQKNLPAEKRDLVLSEMRKNFTRTLNTPEQGETVLKELYTMVRHNIIPFLDPSKSGFIDFTGKLFNVLTSWISSISSDKQNDAVLTPRYVTDMMAALCQVKKDDYLWDYALGTGGFLVSAMKLMLDDADKTIKNMKEREQKKSHIRARQLIGMELLPTMYILAVLNMLLMGDGSANILQGNSLDWDGTYEQGSDKGNVFPATVFLLNPPYSAEGKGFNFVERALSRMARGGRAAVLIQENAGSGNGLPYTKRLLEKHTLKASIHMADIFRGKAGVQTAVYVFDVGVAHDEGREVLFIDMSEDGYTRQNRKKANAETNLRDTDHAQERYAEVVDIVLGRKKKTDFYREDEHVFRDVISLEGNDWMVNQHKKYDTTPTEADFRKTVSDYLAWKVGAILRGEISLEEATQPIQGGEQE